MHYRTTKSKIYDYCVQHSLGHFVKTTERSYSAFIKNERFKQTIDLLDEQVVPKLKVVK